jgi:hypothetical protein
MLGNINQQAPKLPTSRFHPATPPPERHSFCLHCGQRFLKKNVKLLALHFQQQHPDKLSKALHGFFSGENSEIKNQVNNRTTNVSIFMFLQFQILTPNLLGVRLSTYLTPNLQDHIPGRPGAYLQLLDSPFHIYESVDSPKQVFYLMVVRI